MHNLDYEQAVEVFKNTGQVVRLKMERNFLPNFNSNNNVCVVCTTGLLKNYISHDQQEDTIKELQTFWKSQVGSNYDIIVAKIMKQSDSSSLGIGLDTRTIKNIKQKNNDDDNNNDDDDGGGDGGSDTYRHYLVNINPDGVVARQGCLKEGDLLLQVDQYALFDMPHAQVVHILKNLSQFVVMVCGRLSLDGADDDVADADDDYGRPVQDEATKLNASNSLKSDDIKIPFALKNNYIVGSGTTSTETFNPANMKNRSKPLKPVLLATALNAHGTTTSTSTIISETNSSNLTTQFTQSSTTNFHNLTTTTSTSADATQSASPASKDVATEDEVWDSFEQLALISNAGPHINEDILNRVALSNGFVNSNNFETVNGYIEKSAYHEDMSQPISTTRATADVRNNITANNQPASDGVASSDMGNKTNSNFNTNVIRRKSLSDPQTFSNLFRNGWSDQPVYVDLLKEDRGLGFSVFHYSSPKNGEALLTNGQAKTNDEIESLILIRSLVAGGAAEVDGRLQPGDQLISVNNTPILRSNLEVALTALKQVPRGLIRIGVLKPLKFEDDQCMKFGDEILKEKMVENDVGIDITSLMISPIKDTLLSNSPTTVETTKLSPTIATTNSSFKTQNLPHDQPVNLLFYPTATTVFSKPIATASATLLVDNNITISSSNSNSTNSPPTKTPPAIPPKPTVRKYSPVSTSAATYPTTSLTTTTSTSFATATNTTATIVKPARSKHSSVSSLNSSAVSSTGSMQTEQNLPTSVTISTETPLKSSSSKLAPSTPTTPPTTSTSTTPTTTTSTTTTSTTISPPRTTARTSTAATAATAAALKHLEKRLVDVQKRPGQSLGITIVGGRSIGGLHDGVYVKNVNEKGTAYKRLKTGDHILEVNGMNCRDASHEETVEMIKNASSPVWFLVENDNFETFLEIPGPIQQKYGHLKGTLHSINIVLESPGSSLGLILAGNKNLDQMNTFVAAIQKESAAENDGRLQPGDELLEINGHVVHERSHLNASYIIKSISSPDINIVFLRSPENKEKMALNPKSPLLQSKILDKPRLSLGNIGKENVDDSSMLLKVKKEDIKKAKSSEYLHVPGVLPFTIPPLLSASESSHHSFTTLATSSNESLNARRGSNDFVNANASVGSRRGSRVSLTNELEDLKQYDNLETIELSRENNELGISIIGGSDTLLGAIVVNDIYKNGAADKDGRLKVGDTILKVNGTNTELVTREMAMTLLRQGPGKVVLMVSHFKGNDQAIKDEYYDYLKIDLHKKPGQSIGITIIGKHQDSDVHICDLVKGGLAEADGRLKPGDQILMINKQTFKGQAAAAELLKTAKGITLLDVRRLKNDKSSSRLSDSGSNIPDKLARRHPNANLINVKLTRFERGLIMLDLESEELGAFEQGFQQTSIKNISGHEATSRRFHVNDYILSVNEQTTDCMSASDVIRCIQGAHDDVTLEVLRESTQKQDTKKSKQAFGFHHANYNRERPGSDGRQNNAEDRIKIVTLDRGADGYGFTIVGGSEKNLPIYVKNIFEGGPAHRDGRLKKGDILAAVNGESLHGLKHHEALNLLKLQNKTIILMVIER
ncbi:hypothetical protein HELRODRAFT_189608 [Helobdella robusta]|uniref:PDZ domain-containing protein n=1 Tax=Helobdella robusta TaxID=6412 RepID=T1FR71_HELRO|nr:hypothetical protein HELRODRAFT_189608 [Helobdella robusta]ESN92761.1 hypothetical protein HELRODRAFT_189608 [Helobdella robusta]